MRYGALAVMTGWVLSIACPVSAAKPDGLPDIALRVHAECAGSTKTIPARLKDHMLTLTLPAESTWVGWSRESGVDLVFEFRPVDGGAPVRIDSAPARHALDPWWLEVGASGEAAVGVHALGRSRSRALSVELRCLEDLSRDEQALWREAHVWAGQLGVWFDRGGVARAARWLTAALNLGIRVGDRADMRTWLDFQLASAARRAGFLEQSLAWSDRAADRARAHGESDLEALAMLGAGKAALGLGDTDVEPRLEAARARALEAGLAYPALVAGQDLCIAKRLAGRMDEAARCYREAIGESQRLEEWADLATAQSNLANALVTQGDLNGARKALDGALATATAHDSPRVRWMASRLLAQMQTWSGQYVEALATLDETLDSLGSNRPVERGQLLATLAGTYALMGEHARSLATYESVIADMTARGQTVRAQIYALFSAEVELRLDQPERAAQRMKVWLDGEPPESAAAAVRIGRLLRAYALAELGERDAAREEYQRIALSSESWDWPRRMRALGLELELGLTQGEAAARALESAGREALEQSHDLAHLEAVALALEHDPTLTSAESLPWFDPAAALRVRATASLLRSPELRGGLIARLRPLADRVAQSVPSGRATATAVQQALSAIESLRAIEQLPPSGTPGPELAMLERSVVLGTVGADQSGDARTGDAAALNWYASFHRSVRAQTPHVDNWTLPSTTKGELLIHPVLGRHRASLFVSDADGWRVLSGLDADAIRSHARHLSRLLESGLADRQTIASAADALATSLQWRSLAGTRAVGRLLVVADQELGGVAWELLPAFSGPEGQLADASELVVLQSLRPADAVAGFSQLITAGGNSGGSGQLAALGDADAELQDVVRTWEPDLKALALGNSAEALGTALVVPDGLVHVAGHGLVGRGWAEDQGIWLGTAEQPEFFSALRLAQTPSRSALVVLNACETGRVTTPSRIGLAGAAGGLANSGAASVIATRWAVSDRTARKFAGFLHEALRETPRQPARALQVAQMRLRALPAFRHPAEWAAWFLLAPGIEPRSRGAE